MSEKLSELTPQDLEIAVKKILDRSKTDENGCLIWEGARNSRGYGSTWALGKARLSHRLVYAYYFGDPGHLHVCHSCDNPACVNKDHLWAGTDADNNRDMCDKGRDRRPKGEEHGRAKLTADDIANIRDRYVPHSRTRGGAALGRKYDVHEAQIRRIVNYDNWTHI